MSEKNSFGFVLHGYVLRAKNGGLHPNSVVLPVLIILSFGSVSRWMFSDPSQATIAFRGIIFAGLLAWLFLFASSWAVRLIPQRLEALAGALFLLIFGLTELIRAFVLASVLLNNRVVDHVAWGDEAFASFMTGLALYSIAAFFVGDSWVYRRESTSLMQARDQLQKALGNLQKDIQIRREELLSSVRGVITQALRAVIEHRDSGMPVDTKLVAELSRISADVVRPLSHSIYEHGVVTSSLETQQPIFKIRFTRVAVLATVTQPFRPVAVSMILVLLLTPAAVVSVAPLVATVTLAGLVLWTLLSFETANRYVLPGLRRINMAVRILVILVSYLVYALVTSVLLTYLTNVSSGFGGTPQAFYIVVLAVPLLSVLALTPGIRRARTEVLVDLNNANKELSWLNARLAAELWSDRKAIARSLHQDVQGVLIAAAFRLQRALDQGEDISEATAEVYDIVTMAANFVVKPSETATIELVVGALQERWFGILDIRYNATPEASRLLARDRIARQMFQETIDEFALNSVKHGLATCASIELSSQGRRLIQIEFENNGRHIPEDAVFDGLGSRMMASMGVDGRIENLTDGGVRIVASIPVAES